MGPLGNGEACLEYVECVANEGAEFSSSSSPDEVPPEEESASALDLGAPPTTTLTVLTDLRVLR